MKVDPRQYRDCQSASELVEALREDLVRLGWERHILAYALGKPGDIKLAGTYPEAWLARYAEQGYFAADPVPNYCLTAPRPVLWSGDDIKDRDDVPEMAARIMDEAREFGILRGASVPAILRPHITVVGGVCTAEKFTTQDTTLLSPAFEAVAQRLFELNRPAIATVSQRELEVLRLIAKGCGGKEVAARLSISERTFTYYSDRLREKLGAKTLPHLVHLAHQMGLIDGLDPGPA